MSLEDRRDFAKHVLFAGAALGAANHATADDGKKPGLDGFGELDLIVALIQKRLANQKLTPEVLGHVARDVRSDIRRARVLNSRTLTNADEPAPVFAAYRGD